MIAIADRWCGLNGSFKRGLQRWQLFCWRRMSKACAKQHIARKRLVRVFSAWTAYVGKLLDLFRRQSVAADAMSHAVLLHAIMRCWHALVRFHRGFEPPRGEREREGESNKIWHPS